MNIYRQAVVCVDPGACNLLGVANSLPGILEIIETENNKVDHQARMWIDDLITAARAAWKAKQSTVLVNTAVTVSYCVKHMAVLAYTVEESALYHPAMRLIVDQLANLAGCYDYSLTIPKHYELFGEALDHCRERMEA